MTLLYFSPVRWDSYEQRPHYFVRCFLRHHGGRVVWVDPYPTRLPTWPDLVRRRDTPLSTPRPAGLDVRPVRALPFEPTALGRWFNRQLTFRDWLARLSADLAGSPVGIVIGRPSVLAHMALDAVPHAWSAYDAMDDFPRFYEGASRRWTADVERSISQRTTIVIASSTELWRKFADCGDRRLIIRNAFDMASLPAPAAPAPVRPTLGYLGTVSHWFDWPLLVAIAESVPEVAVEIVGPCATRPASLPGNVTLLPACSHEEAVGHLQRFTAGLIPFVLTQLTAGVDPIKYYAYRAMGLPVLSTRFGEIAVRDGEAGLFIVDDRGHPGEPVRRALAARIDPAATAAFRRGNDWSQRFDDAGLFTRVLPLPSTPARRAAAPA